MHRVRPKRAARKDGLKGAAPSERARRPRADRVQHTEQEMDGDVTLLARVREEALASVPPCAATAAAAGGDAAGGDANLSLDLYPSGEPPRSKAAPLDYSPQALAAIAAINAGAAERAGRGHRRGRGEAAAGGGSSSGAGVRAQMLRSGMVLLKGFLSLAEQQRIVDVVRGLGVGAGGFYTPSYESGHKLHCAQMCLGRHWNPRTARYEETRAADGASAPALPEELCGLVQHALRSAMRADDECGGLDRGMEPDVCLCNFYHTAGKMGLHQDKDEHDRQLKRGSPVVSISLGDSATFEYADRMPAPGSRDRTRAVRLDSGDVLVFGGGSRMVFHGVARIHSGTRPQGLHMRQGRLNLTFRQAAPPLV